MIEGVRVELVDATESSARVTLAANTGANLSGDWELYGPHCEYARTLASTFRGRVTNQGNLEFLVTEPCYWSPELPFLYDVYFVSNDKRTGRMRLGLPRLSTHRQSLYRALRRIVLRGMATESAIASKLEEARRAEAALLSRNPSEDECALADRIGVDIIADLRYGNADMNYVLMLTRHPSVAMIMVDGNQLLPGEVGRLPNHALLALTVYADEEIGAARQEISGYRAVVADLHAQERPPAWLATCGRPVVAMRSGAAYADIRQARADCDLLQAEFAPEFDFAGYFVGAAEE